MSNARNLANLLGTDTQITTADIADGAFQANKNLIINGAMQVAQRGTSSTGVSSLGYYTVDRFKTAYNGTPDELRVTHAQSTDAPTGFSSSFKLTITTAETTLASDERVRFQQRIEGQNLQHLKYGTSNAEYITFSFYVKSNVTGTYGVHLDNSDSSRSVCSAYTINAANTWEKKTISFAGDTTGSFGNNSGRSLDVNWVLAAGTNFTSGTFATSWESDTDANNAPSGQVNLIGTVSNYFQTTGVQLEVGEQATPFEHRSYGDELARCQRYYQTLTVLGYGNYSAAITYTGGSNAVLPTANFSTMRTAPTVTFDSSGNIEYYNGSSWSDTTVSPQDTTDNYTVIVALSAGPSGVTRGSLIRADQGTSMNALLDAEL
jgi:hypothetical protein